MLRPLILFLIVNTIVAVERELDFGDYVITTDKDILKSIRTTGSFTNDLNLSNLGLVGLDENTFDYNLKELLRLNLTNNWLTSIPEFVFSNLTNLEYLSLSDNNISCCLENAFVGLRNLKLLDISKNGLTQLESNYFVGLTNSPDILIDGNIISNISTRLFEDTYYLNKRPSKVEEVAIKRNDTEEHHELRVKICYEIRRDPYDLWVQRVNIFNTSELSHDCNETEVDYARGKLFLRDLRTWKFDENWYGLQDFPINSIVLSSNDYPLLSNVTSVLNNLPQNIQEVTFSNRFESCFNDMELSRIENENLRSLILEGTCISKINPSAFEKANLMVLNLSRNNLNDLKFFASLTSSLVKLDLSRNKIHDISPNAFSKFHQLVHLSLSENYIWKLPNQVFRGLSSLQSLNLANTGTTTWQPMIFQDLKNLRQLNLANNGISIIPKGLFTGLDGIEVLDMAGNQLWQMTGNTLYGLSPLESPNFPRKALEVFEPMPFQDLKNLRRLNVANNGISIIRKGLFTGLDNIEVLDMSYNELSEITGNTLYGLPDTLSTVRLDGNRIQTLGNNSFTRVPKHTLSLVGNNINYIASGCFNLPRLQELWLSHNGLRDFSSWGNLKGLKRLFINSNEISTIEEGATVNMGQLEILDLSGNQITKLKNGALFGLPKLRQSVVRLNNVPIKLVQGGVFDHMHGN